MNRFIHLILAALFASTVAVAQDASSSSATDSLEYIEKQYTLFFKVNESDIDREYNGNGKTIETMFEDIKTTLELNGVIADSLTIVASTSPEGTIAINERLAYQRANNTKNLLVELFPQFKPEKIKVTSVANDWSGMALTLRRDTTIRFRDVILKLLTNDSIKNKDLEIRRRLPVAYAALSDQMFNNMRTASIKLFVVRTAENMDEYVVHPELYITSQSPMSFGADGGNGQITYSKTVEDGIVPTVRSNEPWIEAVVPSQSGVAFTVTPNDKKDSRTAVVTVEEYGKSHEVVINQEGREPLLALSTSKLNIPAEGGTAEIAFEKNINDDVLPIVTSNTKDITEAEVEPSRAVLSIKPNNSTQEKVSTVEIDYYGNKYQVEVVQEANTLKPFYMAIKTNMLYDLGLIPNIGLEFYLGKNFSVAGNWMYSWWKSDKVAWYWRTYGGDLAVRYWFGKAAKKKPLTGHHVGLYGQILTYDFEIGKRGYLGDKWTYGGGLEYGYSLPIAERLNIDFDLGVGYLGGEFKEYLPIDGHYVWQATKRRQYIGPTKLEISLVWLLGRGNQNEGKGGKR